LKKKKKKLLNSGHELFQRYNDRVEVVLGQGYLWMVYKTPGSVIWDLSQRSHQLWKMLAQSLEEEGFDPTVELGWKKCGI